MSYLLRRRTVCLGTLLSGLALRAAKAQSRPLEIGVLPNLSARVLLAQYEPMRAYLARVMDRPVQISTAPNWTTFHRRTVDFHYDIVVTAANLARVAQIDFGFVPLVRCVPDIQGLLVVAKERPMASVGDLRGRTLVLSNRQSLVSLRGMRWLAAARLRQGTDFKTMDAPTDDSTGNVVLRGDAVAAMLSGGEFRAIPEAIRGRLAIFEKFADVPGFVVMANPRRSADEIRRFVLHLERFAAGTDEGRAFFAASGFADLRPAEQALMQSLDSDVEATRQGLLRPG